MTICSQDNISYSGNDIIKAHFASLFVDGQNISRSLLKNYGISRDFYYRLYPPNVS